MTFAASRDVMRPRGLTRRGLLKAGVGLTAIGGLVAAPTAVYAAAEAAHDLIVTRYRPAPATWPDSRRLSITVVADLHAGGPNMGIARVAQVVDGANALGSDLIVVLGDFFATHRFVTEHVPHAAWAAELARLKAPLGVYAILGNHDWWYDVDGVRKALAHVRIPLMENDAVLLGEAGRRFWLAGLGDQLAHRIGPSRFVGEDDLPGTMARIGTDDPVILLAHEPDIFVNVPRARGAHARRPHPWRPDQVSFGAAALGAVDVRRAFCLRPYRGARPPHDRVGRARLQLCAAALGRAAGDPARRTRRLAHDPEKWEPVFGKVHAQAKC